MIFVATSYGMGKILMISTWGNRNPEHLRYMDIGKYFVFIIDNRQIEIVQLQSKKMFDKVETWAHTTAMIIGLCFIIIGPGASNISKTNIFNRPLQNQTFSAISPSYSISFGDVISPVKYCSTINAKSASSFQNVIFRNHSLSFTNFSDNLNIAEQFKKLHLHAKSFTELCQNFLPLKKGYYRLCRISHFHYQGKNLSIALHCFG